MSRPFVTLKLATTLDGRIATREGLSRWITGEEARHCVHELRASHDAVLVGIETVLKDDPELTVRLHDYDGPQPTRIVLDSRARLPIGSKLAQTARVIPTWIVTIRDAEPELLSTQVRVVRVPSKHQRVDLNKALEAIAEQGIERLFVEGGAVVATAFLKAGLVDRLEWFRAPTILGGDGRACISTLNIESPDNALRFTRLGVQAVGDDLWESYEIS